MLDVAWLSPVQYYGMIALLITSQGEAVKRALSDAVARVVMRTSPVVPPPRQLT